ncbi:Regulatory protein GemA [Vibrio crassostreae]|uniref:Phage gp16-like protein n=1 Tax=Vibrio crassostreae TaxID=246167 RepID=A0ABM9QU79_9VIBR|nr:regulatory protein GemA [Vibrio crassostreae]CAK1992805.1 Regulatory protein GemA [Vibrio crassostreae]CAK2030423.1 Regulatory protein GemA [Vibrio crassostreae]CAK2085251.1 Regulatory protein GemA [Vibrio crassostreae]CAK2129892.1 Regulatory protein GemA [Vibrio crassostreae]CAK2132402.1 Regulatory protein GemA [Vibrio crassostreae]
MKMKINRQAYYGLVHKGVKALLNDRLGFYDDDEYRNYLGIQTGQTSCKNLSDGALRQLVEELKQQGYLEDSLKFKKRLGGSSARHPSSKQWAKLAALAKSMGWQGLDDPALDSFVKRTVKVERARWLTRDNIRSVIVGLERWLAQKEGSCRGE